MSLLKLPDLGLTLLPFAVLLGGVFSFVRLSRSQELLAIRAAGVSAWNLLAPALTVAVLLGILCVIARDAGLRAAACAICRAWKPSICAAKPRSLPSRATGCGCGKATPTINR